MIDSNAVVRAYLAANAGIIALVGTRIYVPRIPENGTLPAIGLFTRGGTSTPYIPDLLNPSKQIDCWASSPIVARQVYRAVYDALQGIERTTVGANFILSAVEEVPGQDLQDVDIPTYFRVLSFWSIMVR